ncbi:MAG: NADPH-dependent 7-cyano-7-deazaguanine reductase QueF [Gammaproteobacteria bacterium]|nr:NADPH-dependent 7-cyano-7-deazaguanine reductase QueF [Gammaproteobacteria bacterium]
MHSTDNLPLGKTSEYVNTYKPSLLCGLLRSDGREHLGISGDNLPFQGVDIWNAYELSWLELTGKPVVAVAEIKVPASSPYMVESKSLKLYLNSFCHTSFENRHDVGETIELDLSVLVRSPVSVRIILPDESLHVFSRTKVPGLCIDALEIETDVYSLNRDLLQIEHMAGHVSEVLHSHLLRSNCPVTSQPDWGTLVVEYQGDKINHQSLLKYIISYRNHDGFHEQCVEQIFMDIKRCCKPEYLSVYARYTRRGGIDINPYRSDSQITANNFSTFRQ